jgi:hypothetical protein
VIGGWLLDRRLIDLPNGPVVQSGGDFDLVAAHDEDAMLRQLRNVGPGNPAMPGVFGLPKRFLAVRQTPTKLQRHLQRVTRQTRQG